MKKNKNKTRNQFHFLFTVDLGLVTYQTILGLPVAQIEFIWGTQLQECPTAICKVHSLGTNEGPSPASLELTIHGLELIGLY